MNSLSIKLLKEQLKKEEFSNIYLFYGEEEYLKEYYIDELKNKIVNENFKGFNYYFFDGKNIDIGNVQAALESFPVMAEKKMIVIKDSGLFKISKAARDKFWEECIKEIPSYVCLIFYEKEVDKRNEFY